MSGGPVDYTQQIIDEAQKQGIDPRWAVAVAKTESSMNPDAVSPQGARGLMQVMPETAARMGGGDINDPINNIRMGVSVLAQNLKQFGNPAAATAAYFGGTNPAKWGPKTAAYVPKVISNMPPQNAADTDPGFADFDKQMSAGTAPETGQTAPSADADPDFAAFDKQMSTGSAGAVPAGGQSSDASAAPQMSAEARAAHPVAAKVLDVANAIGYNPVSQGVMNGFRSVTDLPAQAMANAATSVGIPQAIQSGAEGLGVSPETAQSIVPTGAQLSAQDQAARDAFKTKYGNNMAAQGANLTEQALLTAAPISKAAGAARLGGNALMAGLGDFATGAGGGNILQKGASMALGGALQGGAGAALTAGGGTTPISQQIEQGAVGGGVLGPVGGAIAEKIGNSALPTYVANLAQSAVQKYGIPLRAGQISSNPMMRTLDDVVANYPGSGGGASHGAQIGSWNAAVAREMGENATSITPDVMEAAKTRLGGVFDSVAAKTPKINADPILGRFSHIEDGAQQTLDPKETAILQGQMNRVLDMVGGDGTISGAQYQALTRKGAPLDRLQGSIDPNVSYYAGQIRSTLDDALANSASPEVQRALSQARYQYKVMKTIEPLVAKDSDGEISPQALMGRVAQNFGDTAYNGGGNMGELARIGQQFLKPPPNSGTAQRLWAQSLLTGGGVGAVGAAMHDPANALIAAGGALGSVAAARATNTLLNNSTVRNAMIAHSLNPADQTLNPLAAALGQRAGNVVSGLPNRQTPPQ